MHWVSGRDSRPLDMVMLPPPTGHTFYDALALLMSLPLAQTDTLVYEQ